MKTSKLYEGIQAKAEEEQARREEPHLFDDEDCCTQAEIERKVAEWKARKAKKS